MIDPRLTDVIRRVLDLPDLKIEDDTQAFAVPGWDSLRHVEILLAIQREFGVRFRPSEILTLKNVGDLQRILRDKSGEPGHPAPSSGAPVR